MDFMHVAAGRLKLGTESLEDMTRGKEELRRSQLRMQIINLRITQHR
jgi:hypothetical protein